MGWLRRRAVPATPGGDAQAPPADRRGSRRGDHAALIAADPYSFETAHRRLAWLLRVSVALNVALGCVAVVEADAVAELVPLKQWRWGLIKTTGPDERLFEVEPLSPEVDGFDLYAEATVKRFVELALSIDPVSEEERLRAASRLADKGFWARFRRAHVDDGTVAEALADGAERSIAVEAVDGIESLADGDPGSGRIPGRKYVVDFVRTDRRRGEELSRRKLRAWLSVEFRPHAVRAADKYVNPFGLTVTALSLKEREE